MTDSHTAAGLGGRELDLACAKALGWTEHEHDPEDSWEYRHWWEDAKGEQHANVPVDFATDPMDLTEKLAWFTAQVDLGGVLLHEVPRLSMPSLWQAQVNENAGAAARAGRDHQQHWGAAGETIYEAVALLVVAVAAARSAP